MNFNLVNLTLLSSFDFLKFICDTFLISRAANFVAFFCFNILMEFLLFFRFLCFPCLLFYFFFLNRLLVLLSELLLLVLLELDDDEDQSLMTPKKNLTIRSLMTLRKNLAEMNWMMIHSKMKPLCHRQMAESNLNW